MKKNPGSPPGAAEANSAQSFGSSHCIEKGGLPAWPKVVAVGLTIELAIDLMEQTHSLALISARERWHAAGSNGNAVGRYLTRSNTI